MTSGRPSAAPWVAPLVAVLVAVAAMWPLPGPTPMRCTYDGDSGTCGTLFYRSALTVSIATVIWGRDVVNERP
jgi:hypothetical protein